MRILVFLCSLAFCGLLWAETPIAAAPAKPEEKPAAPAPAQYSLNIVQYEVSAVPCAAENAMMDTITKKAGYACALQKGRIAINLTGAEAQKVTDFMNKQITVAIEGKKDNYLLVRVKIPGEMDAVFMPVIGGSFVAGYDLDEKKTKGVLLLIYVV
ncbi:MAG TPA: hypothetical protein PLV42_07315 [bacterium]|nr:hypothetical protein [bacterium]